MDKFFANVSKKQSQSQSQPRQSTSTDEPTSEDTRTEPAKALPKGVVLGKDGKPCRSCTSSAAWMAMMKNTTSSPSSSSSSSYSTSPSHPPSIPAPDCPPDVDTLGRSTWTFLHTLTAAYPTHPTPAQKNEMESFLKLFSRLYPCWHCAEDFRAWMEEGDGDGGVGGGGGGNRPRVGSRGELGRWMCEAHNAVNRKLGKGEFECGRWEERWRVGWGDGRCG